MSVITNTIVDDFPINLLDTVFDIRDYIYELIANRKIKAKNIWVIAGLPDTAKRLQLYNKLKADSMIFIEATKEECIRRAFDDDKRKNKDRQIRIINDWFERYTKGGRADREI